MNLSLMCHFIHFMRHCNCCVWHTFCYRNYTFIPYSFNSLLWNSCCCIGRSKICHFYLIITSYPLNIAKILSKAFCDQISHRNDYIADITQYEYCSRKYIVLIWFIFWRLSHPRCFTWKFCYKCKKYIIGQTQFPRLLKRYNFYDGMVMTSYDRPPSWNSEKI